MNAAGLPIVFGAAGNEDVGNGLDVSFGMGVGWISTVEGFTFDTPMTPLPR